MFEKMKNFMAKPVTWGGYFKLCGIVYLIVMIAYAGIIAAYFWNEIIEKVGAWKNKIFKNHDKDTYEIEDRPEW